MKLSLRKYIENMMYGKYRTSMFANVDPKTLANNIFDALTHEDKHVLEFKVDVSSIIKATNLQQEELAKYDKQTLVMVGFGGLNENIFAALNEFAQYFKMEYIFDRIIVFDADKIDISNIPRMTAVSINDIYRLKVDLTARFKNAANNTQVYTEFVSSIDEVKAKVGEFNHAIATIHPRLKKMFVADNVIFIGHKDYDFAAIDLPTNMAIVEETYGLVDIPYFKYATRFFAIDLLRSGFTPLRKRDYIKEIEEVI